MYHILNTRPGGSYQKPPLNAMAIGPFHSFSQGGPALRVGLSGGGLGVWWVRRRVVSAMRKSSTKSCRPTSMGMTVGGAFRYGGITGSGESSGIRGGQGAGRTMPLYNV